MLSPLQSTFQVALEHHQAGRLAEAERIYRHILTIDPHCSEALHFLGVIAHQIGQNDDAVRLIRNAMHFAPADAAMHSNLGGAYRAMGFLDEAIACFRQALRFNPNMPETHCNLGNALRDKGNLEEAVAAYRHALRIQPDNAVVQQNLGVALTALGQLDDAIAMFRAAINCNPHYPEALNNLGNALLRQRRLDDAIVSYRRAIMLKEDFAEAHANLGSALKDQGLLEEAILAYTRALKIHPEHAVIHYNLGIALLEKGDVDGAIGAYRKAISCNPQYPDALNNLGYTLRLRGHVGEAIAVCRRAVDLNPHFAEAYNNLGNAMWDYGQIQEALAMYHFALELKPTYAEAANNLGNALRNCGHLDDAIAALQKALQHAPNLKDAQNNLGNAFKDQGRLDEAVAAYREVLRGSPERSDVHSNLIYALHFRPEQSSEQIAFEQKEWNQRFQHSAGLAMLFPGDNRNSNRILRIGYVSPEFRDHVTGRYLHPLFTFNDRRNFEVICYSGVLKEDTFTDEFRARAHLWRNTVGVSDEALADLIKRDRVDILVDSTQHLAGNRLPMFAYRPAPVQISFAGYPESTGLETIGFRISDKWLEKGGAHNSAGLPVKTESHEQIYLIDTFWCYDPCGMKVPINPIPAQESGRITFGSLNNFCKVNLPLLALWAKVLRTVTASRLIILNQEGSHRQRTLQFLETEGIESRRIEFVAPRPRKEYLELHHRLDIVLDTFPYNGHTTNLDALWMGVPVVSLCGERPVSRAGLSQLSNLGLPELVAFTEDQYVEIATQLANDIPRLKELRATLRTRMECSVLMDGVHFTRQIENCYRSMWRQWCAEQRL